MNILGKVTPNWKFVIPLFLVITYLVSSQLDATMIGTGEYHSFRHTGLFETRHSLFEVASSVATTSQQHAPLYFIMLSWWINLTGTSVFAMRTLSLFAGVLAVAMGYRFARDVLSTRIALWVACGLSLSAFFIYHMHVIRMYTLLPFLAFSFYWLYWLIVSRDKVSWISWFGLYIVATALVYTHYFGIFALLGIGIYHGLTFSRRDRRWWYVVGVMLLAGLTFLPWLPVFVEGMTTRKSLTDSSLSFVDLGLVLLEIYTNRLVVFGLIYIVAIVVLLRFGENQPARYYIACIAIAPIICAIILNEFTPVLPERRMRYSLILLPSFVLLFGVGVDIIFCRFNWSTPILLISWVIAGVVFLPSEQMVIYTNQLTFRDDEQPQMHRITRFIDSIQFLPEPELLITITRTRNFQSSIIDYYSGLMDNPYIHIAGDLVKTGTQKYPLSKLEIKIDLESKTAFWFAYNPHIDPTHQSVYQDVLTKYHRSCGVWIENSEMTIEYFVQYDIPCDRFTGKG